MADFEIQGLGNVLQRMRTLAPKLQQKGARTAARKGANIIRDAARENAKRINDPQTAEDISKNIAVQFASRSSKREGGVVMRVGVKGGARNRMGKMGGGKANPGGDTWYWRLVELGTSRARAQPFMQPALANNVEKVTSTVVAELNKEIDKLVAGGVK